MPYDDFEAMLYSEVPEKPVPPRPQEKPIERFTCVDEQTDAQDEIPIPDAPPEAIRYDSERNRASGMISSKVQYGKYENASEEEV